LFGTFKAYKREYLNSDFKMWQLWQAHKTNLVVEVLNNFPILAVIEDMLQDNYSFFCKSPKKHAAFVKLAEFLESKGNKILRNFKTQWMSMLAPTIQVMNEYRPLLVKMHEDA
jgi:hypothetical protein